MFRYFASIGTGKIVLWCYLIWYLVTVFNHFDPAPSIWLNALGISAVIGIALMLSVGPGAAAALTSAAGRWQMFRLFMTPFCVSSLSALIKDKGFIVIVPPRLNEAIVPVALCAMFVLFVAVVRRVAVTRALRP